MYRMSYWPAYCCCRVYIQLLIIMLQLGLLEDVRFMSGIDNYILCAICFPSCQVEPLGCRHMTRTSNFSYAEVGNPTPHPPFFLFLPNPEKIKNTQNDSHTGPKKGDQGTNQWKLHLPLRHMSAYIKSRRFQLEVQSNKSFILLLFR